VGQRPMDWADVLHWWLDPRHAPRSPSDSQVSAWHDCVSQHFGYRFNWDLGSIIALAITDSDKGNLETPDLADWPETGQPWISLWLKELMTWGTLEPAAAYLLAVGAAVTRQ